MHRIALIGLGLAAGPHIQSLNDLAGRVRVAAAFSRSAARREAFAAKTGLPVTGDLDAIFTDPAIGMVVILTPPSSHLELVERACASGKHILLEKPLDISTERAERLVFAVETAGATAAVMLQHRFKPSAQRLAAVLAEGGLGTIIGVSVRVPLWRPQSYYNVAGRGTRARDGGGVLLSQAIHTIDLMRALCGPAARVAGFARDGAGHRMETEDIATAALRFQNGAIGSIDATTCAFPGSLERIEIIGTLGTASLAGTGLSLRWQDGRSEDLAPDDFPGGTGADPMAFSHAAHRAAWTDFLDAVDGKRAPRVTPRDALQTHYLIAAMLQSAAKDGAPVEVKR
jgi:UDP-N-acetyl-2-amino-2-deoxyglucuronate dehydrogenase